MSKNQDLPIKGKPLKIKMLLEQYLPTDFRKSIYDEWFNESEKMNIKLKLVESDDYQDIFLATLENEKLRFRVWYRTSEQQHTKGFFSKIEVLEKTSDCLYHTRS